MAGSGLGQKTHGPAGSLEPKWLRKLRRQMFLRLPGSLHCHGEGARMQAIRFGENRSLKPVVNTSWAFGSVSTGPGQPRQMAIPRGYLLHRSGLFVECPLLSCN